MVLWVVGVLCLGSAGRIGGTSVVGVSVFIAQVRLGGAWAGMYARHVVFASYLNGVAVAFKPYFWWCMRGLLLVGVLLVLAWRFLVVSRRHVSAPMGGY